MIRLSTPRPAPSRHSASVATFASFSIAAGTPKRSLSTCPSATSSSGMLFEPSAWPVVRSITEGMPSPRAATPAPASGSIAATIPSTSSACEPVGVGTSRRSSTRPSPSIEPARIFVPPRSTPMTMGALTSRGYHTRPDGGRREALPGLQGRQGQGEGADRRARRAAVATRRRPPDEGAGSPALGPPDRADAAPPLRAPRRLDGRELPLLPRRRRRRERAAAQDRRGRARAAGGRARLEAVADPPARHRRRQDLGALGRGALGLDPARPNRPRPPPAGLPLDPARPARRHSRLRAVQDQCRLPARRRRPDDEDRTRAHGPAAEPRRDGRLRRLPHRDRRARRSRDRRAEADPLQPLRLPLRDGG